MNASEARMSSSIRSRDGTHPDADLIYDAGLTVTLPSATIRRQIALHIADDRVEIAGAKDVASAPVTLAHVLRALSHRFGSAWQGVVADWHRGCSQAPPQSPSDDANPPRRREVRPKTEKNRKTR